MGRFFHLEIVTETHKGTTRVKHGLELLQIVRRIVLCQLILDFGLAPINANNEINHDTVNGKISCNYSDVAEHWSIIH